MASTRIVREVTGLKGLEKNSEQSGEKFIVDKSPVDNPSSNVILGRIFPKSAPYNQKSFQIEIKFPPDYPFKAPDLRFTTKIYHPNVEWETGRVCLTILSSPDKFKATTTLVEVFTALVHLIDNPDLDHALSPGEKKKKQHLTLIFQLFL